MFSSSTWLGAGFLTFDAGSEDQDRQPSVKSIVAMPYALEWHHGWDYGFRARFALPSDERIALQMLSTLRIGLREALNSSKPRSRHGSPDCGTLNSR